MTSISPSQEAREVAASWAKLNGRNAQAANIKRGSCDNAPIVQAFATFEAQIEARRTPPSDELRERVARLIDPEAWSEQAAQWEANNKITRTFDIWPQRRESSLTKADSIIALLPGREPLSTLQRLGQEFDLHPGGGGKEKLGRVQDAIIKGILEMSPEELMEFTTPEDLASVKSNLEDAIAKVIGERRAAPAIPTDLVEREPTAFAISKARYEARHETAPVIAADLVERLRKLLGEATPGPWAYRPCVHDDWGIIRGPEVASSIGPIQPIVAVARAGQVGIDYDEHRRNGTDPYEPTGRLIVETLNALPALLDAIEGKK